MEKGSKRPRVMVRVKTWTVMMWCVQDEVNQEESEQDDVDGMEEAD